MTRGAANRSLIAAGMIMVTPAASRANPEEANSRPKPSLFWRTTRLIPSPELVSGSDGTSFGLRWQVTPVLYAFGLDHRVSPWRTFVVEPPRCCSGP